jgi:hypothetical protein
MKLTTGDCCGTVAGMPISSSGAPDDLRRYGRFREPLLLFAKTAENSGRTVRVLAVFSFPEPSALRISAGSAMSMADNSLQKQQKQPAAHASPGTLTGLLNLMKVSEHEAQRDDRADLRGSDA